MTKTELKKMQIKKVLEFLVDQFEAQIDDNGDGGRFDITIGDFHGQMSRRDLVVDLWDSIPLHGDGFFPAEVLHQQDAVAFEKQIIEEIQKLLCTI